MAFRRLVFVCSVCLTFSCLPGCMTFGMKNGRPYFSKSGQHEPDPDDKEDKWSSVGKMARGNRQLDDENDPVKSMIMSKQAQDIERNLGYK